MKLEVVHPQNRAEICPASITEVFDDKYFLVTVDDMSQKNKSEDDDDDDNDSSEMTWLATISNPYILPYGK